jgi:hypothetical protein
MSDINLDFTVNNNSINFTVEPNDITITPTDIQLTFNTSSQLNAGGSNTQLQYNNGSLLAGIPTATYNGSNLSLGNVANLKITGGVNGYVLQTDGTGNLDWAAAGGGGGNGSPGGSNTQIQYNDSGAFGGNAGFTFNEITGNVNMPSNLSVTGNIFGNVQNAYLANFANVANSVAGANVSGAVGLATFATTANAVAGANVSGTVANANYSAFAGQANTANLATFATTANAVAGANVSGTVANANYSAFAGQANTANLATFATTANAVAGANVSGQVANALIASTVYTNAQPNITSVGTIINLNVGNIAGSGNIAISGNITAANIGNIARITLNNNFSTLLTGNGVFATYDPKTLTADFTFTGNTATSSNTSANTNINFAFSANYVPGGWVDPAFPLIGSGWNVSNALNYGTANASLGMTAYGGNKFVTLTNSTAIVSTDDGVNWTEYSLGVTAGWRALTYGGGRFVAVSPSTSGTYGKYITSTDGITWATGNIQDGSGTTGISSYWNCLVYDGTNFVALTNNPLGGFGTGTTVAKSTNGSTWTVDTCTVTGGFSQGFPAWGSSPIPYNSTLSYGGGYYIAFGTARGTTFPDAYYNYQWSTDAIVWRVIWNGTSNLTYVSSAYGSNTHLAVSSGVGAAVGAPINTIRIPTSNPNLASTGGPAPSTANLLSVIYTSNLWFFQSNTQYYTSNIANATTYTRGHFSTLSLDINNTKNNSWAYGNGKFVQMNGQIIIDTTSQTAYKISFPADGIYSANTLTFTPNISNSVSNTASALGNAITTLRPTYTATYPSAGTVTINTVSNTFADLSVQEFYNTATTGSLTTSINQDTSVRDCVNVTFNRQDNLPIAGNITYVPAFADSLSNVINGIAVNHNIGNFATSVCGVSRSQAVLRATSQYGYTNIGGLAVITAVYPNVSVTANANCNGTLSVIPYNNLGLNNIGHA